MNEENKVCKHCGSTNVRFHAYRYSETPPHNITAKRYFCNSCRKYWSVKYKPQEFSTTDAATNVNSDMTADGKFNYEFIEDNSAATLNSKNFKSDKTDKKDILSDFLEECGVDRKKWKVVSYKISGWDVSSKWRDQDLEWDGKGLMSGHAKRKNEWLKVRNYSISVKLAPNDDAPVIEGYENFIKNLPKFPYVNKIPKVKHKTGHALEVAPLDAHFGKLAWEIETGYRNYDLNIASEDYEYSIDDILSWANYFKPEKIYYIVGQDLFHIDNIQGRTTKGEHDLDVDGRMPKIYEKVYEIITKSVYKCRAMAPVEIIWIPGNHDFLASMFLTYHLHEHFKDDKYVCTDIWTKDGKKSRKARLWGNLLIGWTHEIKTTAQVKWVNELAQAFPKLWGQSTFREWHYGHFHNKQTTKLSSEFTSGGVTLRQLTALSPPDRWHYDNVFTDSIPGGEAYIWTLDKGIKSNIISWTSQYNTDRDKIVEQKSK